MRPFCLLVSSALGVKIINLFQWITGFPIRIKVAKLFNSYEGEKDNWKYINTKYSPYYLGSKCQKDFSKYFKGSLTVNTNTAEEAIKWLNTCTYEENNGKWKHPIELEKTKKGDCKDFCLWLWRSLTESDYEALFVSGERIRDGGCKQHAWVVFMSNNKQYIIDPLSLSENSILELDKYKDKYIPWLAVTNTIKYQIYGGYIRNNANNP